LLDSIFSKIQRFKNWICATACPIAEANLDGEAGADTDHVLWFHKVKLSRKSGKNRENYKRNREKSELSHSQYWHCILGGTFQIRIYEIYENWKTLLLSKAGVISEVSIFACFFSFTSFTFSISFCNRSSVVSAHVSSFKSSRLNNRIFTMVF